MAQPMNNQNFNIGRHGGDIETARQQYARKKFLDLSISINPWGPPFVFWIHVLLNLIKIKEYPQPYTIRGQESLGSFFGTNPNQFVIGNGGAELIRNIPVALPVERALVIEPTFSEYEQAFLAVNKPVIRVQLDSHFNIPMSTIAKILKPNDLVFICQPNNPTGNLFDEDSLAKLLELTYLKKSWLAIDESFLWFCGDLKKISFQRHLCVYPNLIILNSLTKIGAIPGLRLGFLLTNPRTAAIIRANLNPWCVNHLAQRIISVILQTNYLKKTVGKLLKENQWLQKKLANIPGLTVYPWDANFYLIKVKLTEIKHDDFIAQLAKAGILVRDCRNFSGLGLGYFRVAVGRRHENIKFLYKLRNAVKI